jgi:diguanylate cyclase (GGDEF)-like protein
MHSLQPRQKSEFRRRPKGEELRGDGVKRIAQVVRHAPREQLQLDAPLRRQAHVLAHQPLAHTRRTKQDDHRAQGHYHARRAEQGRSPHRRAPAANDVMRRGSRQHLALTDSLKGTLKRKAFLQAVGKEIERAARTNRPFSVAYIDIDDFKKLNDACGHRTGDELLIEFVSTCNGHLSSSDAIGRMGGDEFALLLPETDEGTCEDTLGRLLSVCNAASWNARAMTFSIGALTCLRPPADIDAVILRADSLMYQVKRAGKVGMHHALYRNGSVSARDDAEPLSERWS